MSERATKNIPAVGKAGTQGTAYRRSSIDTTTTAVQDWLEKASLEREIALKQRRLTLINGRLRAAGFLVRDDLPSQYGNATPLDPTKRVNLIDVIETIANESPHPISKAELRRGLVAMGLPLEKLNNYFYQAIRKLRSRGRISVLKNGKVWRP